MAGSFRVLNSDGETVGKKMTKKEAESLAKSLNQNSRLFGTYTAVRVRPLGETVSGKGEPPPPEEKGG